MIREVKKGVNGIVFIREIFEATLLNPLKNFQLDKHRIEIRRDPLTGLRTRINIERALRVKQSEIKNIELAEIVKTSISKCYFCENNIFKHTPKIAGYTNGRFIEENSVLFPNLYPFGIYHGVVVLNMKEHYENYSEIDVKDIHNSLKVTINYFKWIHERDRKAKYPTINFNFLFPAGASIIHPHLQILLDYTPTLLMRIIIKKSLKYYEKYKSNMWKDYVESEKKLEERYITEGKIVHWIASFAPRANCEVIGVLKVEKKITQLSEEELWNLSQDIHEIFKKYQKGIKEESIKMTIFDPGFNNKTNGKVRVHIRLIARKNPEPYYVNDRGFMETLHLEPVVEHLPEKVAETLRTQ